MNWRPEGWKNPHPRIEDAVPDGYMPTWGEVTHVAVTSLGTQCHQSFEAGAGAMLKAVCEEIGKVENPYKGISTEEYGMVHRRAFAEFRAMILAMFQKEAP